MPVTTHLKEFGLTQVPSTGGYLGGSRGLMVLCGMVWCHLHEESNYGKTLLKKPHLGPEFCDNYCPVANIFLVNFSGVLKRRLSSYILVQLKKQLWNPLPVTFNGGGTRGM